MNLNSAGYPKDRIIVTTDGEKDDRSSFIRFLLYVNEWDIEGLVYTNSMWHPQGEGTTWMAERLDAYEEALPKLRSHAEGFPAADELRSKLAVGEHVHQGMDGVGPDRDTEGSDLIVESILKDDPRPLWIQLWGGANTVAQAFFRIAERYPQRKKDLLSKVRLYAIAEQEKKSASDWIAENYPEVLFVRNSYQFWRCIAYEHDRLNPLSDHEMYQEEWLEKHVRSLKPLGPLYPMEYMSEGDSPAFFHMIPTGLRSVEHPAWGGWGGRFERSKGNFWIDAEDEGDKAKPLWRFMEALTQDFIARMQWTQTVEHAAAEHPPVVKVSGEDSMALEPGGSLELDGSASSSPDGNPLSFKWWIYQEAGDGEVSASLKGAESSSCILQVASDSPAGKLHLILEVCSSREYSLTRYKRVVVKVG